MIDIEFIRQQPEVVKTAAKNKNVAVDIDALLKLDSQRRELQTSIDHLNRQRNQLAEQTGKPSAEIIAQGKTLKEKHNQLEHQQQEVSRQWEQLLKQIPNIPSNDTPIGDAKANKVLRQVGEKPTFDFQPKEHWQLGQELSLIDNERAAKVAGSRFTYLKGPLAWLEFALIQHALTVLTNEEKLSSIAQKAGLNVPVKPFIPVIPPVLIKPEVFDRMARLEPKEERYYIPSDDLFLVGSAEHTLGAIHMDETLPESALPLRYVGFSTAFRREAGSYGKDVHGILRVHQFDKLEIESFTMSEHSDAEQEFIVAIQEYLMQSLALPYQVVLVASGDMGAPDQRQIDIETWLPGQNLYRETHTSDLIGDYQARRLHTKVRRADGNEYVHMNDATVFAIGRTLIAILENNQRSDGSVTIPKILHPYLPFTTIPATA